MYRRTYGHYRHKQYDIKRGSYAGDRYLNHIGTSDDSINGWYVDHKDADGIDRRGTGFATLKEAIDNIDFEVDVVARRR